MASRGAICNWLSEAGLCLAQASAIRADCAERLREQPQRCHATSALQAVRQWLESARGGFLLGVLVPYMPLANSLRCGLAFASPLPRARLWLVSGDASAAILRRRELPPSLAPARPAASHFALHEPRPEEAQHASHGRHAYTTTRSGSRGPPARVDGYSRGSRRIREKTRLRQRRRPVVRVVLPKRR